MQSIDEGNFMHNRPQSVPISVYIWRQPGGIVPLHDNFAVRLDIRETIRERKVLSRVTGFTPNQSPCVWATNRLTYFTIPLT